eukprot:6211386-Pleurochrysis_carterae.AAC.1
MDATNNQLMGYQFDTPATQEQERSSSKQAAVHMQRKAAISSLPHSHQTQAFKAIHKKAIATSSVPPPAEAGVLEPYLQEQKLKRAAQKISRLCPAQKRKTRDCFPAKQKIAAPRIKSKSRVNACARARVCACACVKPCKSRARDGSRLIRHAGGTG